MEHDQQHLVDAALAEAERVCAARGSRLTDLRKKVLRLVWQRRRAVKAYDLLGELAAEGGSAKPPTIYRALDFLMEQGLVHKLSSINAFIGCPHPLEDHVSHFLICSDCGIVAEMGSEEADNALAAAAANAGFAVRAKTVELTGLCADCQRASAQQLSGTQASV